MQRIVLFCTALAFGVSGSSLAAQQTSADQSSQQAQPSSAPDTAPLPPPPPFPPMPSSRPSHRWVDMGGHRSKAVSHRASSSHAARKHTTHEATRKHRAGRHEAKNDRQPAVHLSRRTIRSCHKMSYTQIMRQSDCRALMSQELAAAEHRDHRAARRQKGAKHGHSAKADRRTATHRHDQTAKRRRR